MSNAKYALKSLKRLALNFYRVSFGLTYKMFGTVTLEGDPNSRITPNMYFFKMKYFTGLAPGTKIQA